MEMKELRKNGILLAGISGEKYDGDQNITRYKEFFKLSDSYFQVDYDDWFPENLRSYEIKKIQKEEAKQLINDIADKDHTYHPYGATCYYEYEYFVTKDGYEEIQ